MGSKTRSDVTNRSLDRLDFVLSAFLSSCSSEKIIGGYWFNWHLGAKISAHLVDFGLLKVIWCKQDPVDGIVTVCMTHCLTL